MYDFYQQRFDAAKLKRSRKELKRLYSQIPETTGCMENIAKPDGCKAWCCEIQTPQVMYSEFLNTWNFVVQNWHTDEIAMLVMQCVQLYLQGDGIKGCVFFDQNKRTCKQHQTRPFNCRTYGQIPEEEFRPRYEQLKVLYPDREYRDQCNLVETQGQKPTEKDMDEWFHHLQLIELDLLGSDTKIHDKEDGSYRTYHDHILLRVGNFPFLMNLTKLRTNGTEKQKELFMQELEAKLKKNLAAKKESV